MRTCILALLTTMAAASGAPNPNLLVEPYDPPPLAELDAKAEWVEMPVQDSLKHLTDYLATQKPLATEQEALSLSNDSDEANAKILSGLGRQPKSPSDADFSATWNRRLGGEVKSTNPLLQSSTSEFDVVGYTAAGLFSFDWNLIPFAASEFVKSWHTSKDRMVDKIVLRDDMTWSDGRPITAHDVVFSYLVIMDKRVPIPAVRSGTDELKWVHAYDDRTLVYFHKAPKATNVWNINFPIIPKHVFEKSYDEDPTLAQSDFHVKLENEPVCGGPYVFGRRQRGGELVLKRRESYYTHNGKQVRDKPYFDTVRFRIVEDTNTALLALKAAEVDETNLSPQQWMRQTSGDEFYKTNTKVRATEWTSFHFVWNMKKPFFSDKRVRKAMAYAYDYEELLERLCYGLYEPCAGIFYPTAWMAPNPYPQPYQQDLDKAEDLLDEAGWEDSDDDGVRDKDGQAFRFSLMYRNDPEIERYCKVLQQNLNDIGVVCDLRPTEFTVLVSKLQSRDFDAAFGGWGTGADPDTSRNIWGTGEARNYAEYSNPEVDRLFELAAKEFDRKKRGELYGRIHTIIFEDQPYTFLYWRAAFFGFNKSLRGYHMSPRGPYHYGPGASAIWKVAP